MIDMSALLARLERTTADLDAPPSRLILLLGPPGSGKTRLLRAFGERRGVAPLNVGAALGRRLIALPVRQRPLQAAPMLRELITRRPAGDPALLDNLELLFDETLKLDPLELLRRLAQSRRIVAVWPGELRQGDGRHRLSYAPVNHPEHEDLAADGVILFQLEPH